MDFPYWSRFRMWVIGRCAILNSVIGICLSNGCNRGVFEPPHVKTNKMTFAPSEDSDQPGHPPSRIRVFAIRKKKHWILSYPLSAVRRLWSDWANAQADQSLRWAHRSVCWFCHEVAHLFSTECAYISIHVVISPLVGRLQSFREKDLCERFPRSWQTRIWGGL